MLDTLEHAVWTRRRHGVNDLTGLVHHTDAGSQGGSTGPRNTMITEALVGRPAGWMTALTGRSPMKSPGAPSHRREVEREFRREIAKGLLSEDAAAAVGVSPAVGTRWFRHGGGMPSVDLSPLTGRYLSFREREEIAILTVQGVSIRATARQLGRATSTISRELRRNAAARGGKLEYRASVAQWRCDLEARWPKTAKLLENERLREYVQERLSGAGAPTRRELGRRSWVGAAEGPRQAASRRPPLDNSLESGADLQSTQNRPSR